MGLDIYFYKTRKNNSISTIDEYYKQVYADKEKQAKSIIDVFTNKLSNATEKNYDEEYKKVFSFFADLFKDEPYMLDDDMQNNIHPLDETLEWLKNRGEHLLTFNVEVAYFRKVNFIYAFFANKLEDEACFVTKSDLEDLYNRCAKIDSTNGELCRAKKELEQINNEIEQTSNEIVKDCKAGNDTNSLTEKNQSLIKKVNELKEKIEILESEQVDVEELLPTRSGFFFGSTAYDEWYYYDVHNAATTFKELIDEFDENEEVMFVIMSW
jgi:hypothetical protein